jgi:tRNA-splicing ligase RtcB (3'-phosphate/5'-hydroxy nucleic acid ligase)
MIREIRGFPKKSTISHRTSTIISLMNTIHVTDDAIGFLPLPGDQGKPITVIGNAAIRKTFDDATLQQAVNSRMAPGVTDVILNPDGHVGYGAPIGCVMVSPTHIYPGPVGVDIKCSMSLLQMDIPEDVIADKRLRRALIEAITARTPTGAGQGYRSAKKSRFIDLELGIRAVTEGASQEVCEAFGIPFEWAKRCEDSSHKGHDGTYDALRSRLQWIQETGRIRKLGEKLGQFGSYGGGNHFGECEITRVIDRPSMKETAEVFGLKDGHVSFLSHCGSRGFGNLLATHQFRDLERKFDEWNIPYPAGDKKLVYAPLGTPEANAYLDDMALGANFATLNHLLINALVLDAFQEVLPGTTGNLVYFISHNIAREEILDGKKVWVHRKGATRAVPGGHFSLHGTPFAETGHPILLPGNPRDGSVVMVARGGAERTAWSVNHGAGRRMGRKHATRELDQKTVDTELDAADIMSNCRQYPIDEAPDAYKNFKEVLNSVESAGLAETVAKLEARFVIKDSAKADD